MVKWEGYRVKEGGQNWEPEGSLVSCKLLPKYWQKKNNYREAARVQALLEEALVAERE